MGSALNIAPGLRLDADYVGGGTFALLAKKGAGKTYQGRVMAEEFWRAKVPFVAIDPMGAWWGLRSSADGQRDGIPVAIFGGEHGDAPLERGSGQLMADLVVDEGLSMVLDLKGLGTRAAERQFALDFLERLYRRNSELVHLLIDEADLFAPQQPQAGDRPLLGVTENIVRRGRNSGIGVTLITQRPAVLNKDVLTQVDGLVAMRIIGLTDREAIDEWVKGHGDPDAARQVKGSLAGLANGECWWWVPELDVLKRVQVRESRTFDSSPTRKRGAKPRQPKGFADVDMGAIETRMAETIERAKAVDPKHLRAELAQAHNRIRELEQRQPEPAAPERIEVPVISEKVVEDLTDALSTYRRAADDVVVLLDQVVDALARMLRERASAPAPSPRPVAQQATRRPPPPPPAPARDASRNGNAGDVTPAKQRILDALAALEQIGVTQAGKTQLALFAKASPKSSGYANNLGSLRTAGLIDYPAPATVALTPDGRAIANNGTVPTTADELHAYVRSLVGPSKARIIDALVDAYPDALTKDDLAERASQSPTSSGYANNLGSLRSLGLIDYPSPGWVAALPVLFPTVAA